MKVIKKKRLTTEVISDRICNKCGMTLMDGFEKSFESFYGLIDAKVEAGYFSPIFNDGDLFEFDLCEECLEELFSTFKHNPYVGTIWERAAGV